MRDQDEPTTPAPDPDRDALTVELLRAGDPEGLQRLLQDHGALVKCRLIKDFGKVLDGSEIEEAMSVMTVSIWHAAARFDSQKGTLRAWALVIARNCALRLLEVRRRTILRSESDLDLLAAKSTQRHPPTAERLRLLADLQTCIAQLPRLQQAVLRADLEAGTAMPAGELAARLGTTPNSIYVSRLKGRQGLRIAMQAMGHSFPGMPPTTETTKPDSPILEPGTEQG
ncbi:MAG: sigma-70 family RNA polymerase sigma factor [Planctomycetes bacterium]|nr:sigma-70 family RNA polymerase sigma factor [Planctomycetota bacterium]